MISMMKIFFVGDMIGDYCNGYFGRDDCDNKTCVFVTPFYAVFQNEEGKGSILNYEEGLEKVVKGENWKHQPI